MLCVLAIVWRLSADSFSGTLQLFFMLNVLVNISPVNYWRLLLLLLLKVCDSCESLEPVGAPYVVSPIAIWGTL